MAIKEGEAVMNIPIAVMIGGMRCGTRAFLRYLSQHPAILPHEKAHDPHFFSKEENWTRGVEAYLAGWSEFKPRKHAYAFESSTHYTKYPAIKDVPERMKETGLDFRFIYSVRDPIKRIESHLVHNAGKGYLDATDPEARTRFFRSALNYSRYAMQLERFLALFPENRFYLFQLESLVDDYVAVMKETCEFLKIDADYAFKRVPVVGTKFKVPVDDITLYDEEVKQLRAALHDDIQGLLTRFNMSDERWSLFRGDELRPSASNATAKPGVIAEPKTTGDVRPPAKIFNLTNESGSRNGDTGTSPIDTDHKADAAPAIIGGSRYAMLTVDTEALPKRAPHDHVKRLIWCEHDNGTAGIREMCSITHEVGGKLVFFVDTCESEFYGDEISDVIRWLHNDGQDVQLHTHPEQLPPEFWAEHGFEYRPRFLNEYADDKAEFVIKRYSKIISDITGVPVLGFRAGSFRWNAGTLRALHAAGIPVSFNNRVIAARDGKCPYSEPTNVPYYWSNGVIEVPMTETQVTNKRGKSWLGFKFPISQNKNNGPRQVLEPFTASGNESFLVLLLHSWSLLHWDENGYGVYRDDQRIEEYRQIVHQMAKDYDIITTPEFLELQSQGKINPTHTVPLARAEHQAVAVS